MTEPPCPDAPECRECDCDAPQPPDGELHIDDDSELMGATREALLESRIDSLTAALEEAQKELGWQSISDALSEHQEGEDG